MGDQNETVDPTEVARAHLADRALGPGSGSPKPLFYDYPTFDGLNDERRHRKERLTAAFRIFGRFGFSEGVAGHITARDPEHTDCFWVNPFGRVVGAGVCWQ